jgi:hypothetical protein
MTRSYSKRNHSLILIPSSWGNNSGNSHTRVKNLVTQHVGNDNIYIYLMFEVDTLKIKKKISSIRGD